MVRLKLLAASLAALGSLAWSTPVAPATIVPGSYAAVKANGGPLPWTTRVPAVKGLTHWARLDLAVLRLGANGRYSLSYRYTQEVLDSSRPGKLPPPRDEVSTGRYSQAGNKLTFVPVKGNKPQRAVVADVVGSDILLDKTVFVGERPFHVKLLFRRDPSYY
jgi:hypothetical protein